MAAVMALTTSAFANQAYVGIAGGVSVPEDSSVRDVGDPLNGNMSLKTGYSFCGIYCVTTDLGLRPEIELTYES